MVLKFGIKMKLCMYAGKPVTKSVHHIHDLDHSNTLFFFIEEAIGLVYISCVGIEVYCPCAVGVFDSCASWLVVTRSSQPVAVWLDPANQPTNKQIQDQHKTKTCTQCGLWWQMTSIIPLLTRYLTSLFSPMLLWCSTIVF